MTASQCCRFVSRNQRSFCVQPLWNRRTIFGNTETCNTKAARGCIFESASARPNGGLPPLWYAKIQFFKFDCRNCVTIKECTWLDSPLHGLLVIIECLSTLWTIKGHLSQTTPSKLTNYYPNVTTLRSGIFYRKSVCLVCLSVVCNVRAPYSRT